MHNDLGLGKLIQGEAYRDAIHVAVAPVVAATALKPGLPVGLDEQGRAACNVGKCLGIVDPFLRIAEVKEGDKFWLFLFPNTVVGMRHEWMHPSFPIDSRGVDTVAESKQWIEVFAAAIDQTYNRVMEAAEQYMEGGWERWTYDNSESYKGHYDKWPEFWKHYERITGKSIDPEDKDACPFTCSC